MQGSQSEAAKEDEKHNKQLKPLKGKSCKGYLYHSSILKSKGRNPFCVGLTRTLQQVPGYIVGESEMEASKDGRSLTDFKYACVGYSVYLDNKDSSADPKKGHAELPFCVGIELLVDKRASTTDNVPAHTHIPAHAHTKEGDHALPPPQAYKPSHAIEDFLGRFTRNAGLVASGVGRNMQRVGNYVKDNVNDMLYPYRRRPK